MLTGSISITNDSDPQRIRFAPADHCFSILLLQPGVELTLEDLASYKARVSDAWNVSLGEYQVYLAPPPSGGALIGLILNIMKGFNTRSHLHMDRVVPLLAGLLGQIQQFAQLK